ncbi:hypothetical protein O1R50_16050 [Glycomyces luteolus]|uniref:Uncharacterized protein n=1 Tax=Glycomyces luteolus TaxID=2670330 RepID=A0A9X3PEJ4_9ACTN|nr:hypothetical protein [Glycomyces luteolus]MDA1361144.1 hypothetical protein [Glycomyces luteolus]
MAPEPAERPARRKPAVLRGHRLAVVAVTASLAVLVAATLTAAAPSLTSDSVPGATEQDPVDENPNYKRVGVSTPGATIEILGLDGQLSTGAITGEVDLAKPEGEQAMSAANLVASSDEELDFGQVYLAIRPGIPVDYQYDTSAESIIFNPGLEFRAETVPGLTNGTDRFLYTQPIRMLPTEPVADPQFPPYERTFAIPSMALLWEGEDGITGSEPIGFISEFELTVTHAG